MLFTAISIVRGFAAKAATGPVRRHASRRHLMSPTFFGRTCGTRPCGAGVESLCRTCVFMMDVRMLLLIIGFGRNGPTLE
jgi:hypothetical protein